MLNHTHQYKVGINAYFCNQSYIFIHCLLHIMQSEHYIYFAICKNMHIHYYILLYLLLYAKLYNNNNNYNNNFFS